MSKLTPLDDRLIVEPISEDEKTASGIFIPDTGKEKPQRGKVTSAGPGKFNDNGERRPMTVKEGDIILFTKYAPNEIKVDGQELFVLNESDVLAIVS